MSTQYAELLRQRINKGGMSGSALMGGVLGGKLTQAEQAAIDAAHEANNQRNLRDGVEVGMWFKEEGKDGKIHNRWGKGHISGEEYARRREKAIVTRKITSLANKKFLAERVEEYKMKNDVTKIPKVEKEVLRAYVKAKTAAMKRKAKSEKMTEHEMGSYLLSPEMRASFTPSVRSVSVKPKTLEDFQEREAKAAARAKAYREKQKALPAPLKEKKKELRKALKEVGSSIGLLSLK